jgi:hypothetical protein
MASLIIDAAVAVCAVATPLILGYLEFKSNKEAKAADRINEIRWENNTKEHLALVGRMDSANNELAQKIDAIGHTLGISIDRVEEHLSIRSATLEERIVTLDERIHDHVINHP